MVHREATSRMFLDKERSRCKPAKEVRGGGSWGRQKFVAFLHHVGSLPGGCGDYFDKMQALFQMTTNVAAIYYVVGLN